MRKLILTATVALVLTACATPQPPQIMTWSPTGTAAAPLPHALAECRYDIIKDMDRNNFDQLFLLSGQSPIGPNGEVGGLSDRGRGMFELCMRTRGYAPGGMVPYVGGK